MYFNHVCIIINNSLSLSHTRADTILRTRYAFFMNASRFIKNVIYTIQHECGYTIYTVDYFNPGAL